MRLAACQLPDVRRDIPRALAMVVSYAGEAAGQGASLVCFPECFLQGYDITPRYVADEAIDLRSMEFHSVLESLVALEPVIVLGLIERQANRYFNTAVAIHRGELLARYRKVHLLEGERCVFEAGAEYPVFDVCGVKSGINICYDLCFADGTEALRAAGADLLVCPCNNMMSSARAEQWKGRHNEIRAKRAREAGVWLSSDVTGRRDGRVSYGPTAVIDPAGNVVDQVPLMTAGMIVTEMAGRAASACAAH